MKKAIERFEELFDRRSHSIYMLGIIFYTALGMFTFKDGQYLIALFSLILVIEYAYMCRVEYMHQRNNAEFYRDTMLNITKEIDEIAEKNAKTIENIKEMKR